MIPFGLQAGAAFRLDARQFEFFGKDLRQLLHREIDFEDMRAGSVSGLPVAVFVNIARTKWSTGLTFTLADTAGIAAAEPEVGHFDLWNGDADEVLALLADQLSL